MANRRRGWEGGRGGDADENARFFHTLPDLASLPCPAFRFCSASLNSAVSRYACRCDGHALKYFSRVLE